MTQCTAKTLTLQPLGKRQVQLDFAGGQITGDAGVMLLRGVEQRLGVLRQLAACFVDQRNPKYVEHSVQRLLGQRIFGLALGREDLNDHEELRADPVVAAALECQDPTGQQRRRPADQGKALAGKSTLNRLELPVSSAADARYKRIVADPQAIADLLPRLFLQLHPKRPTGHLILDVDATDIAVHGQQEQRFYHGYYGHYCYLPLYICCGDFPLVAELRPADCDAATGVVEQITRLVGVFRAAWPKVPILVRGDSGFCRDKLLTWCEQNAVDYVVGIARNTRLEQELAPALAAAAAGYAKTRTATRVFAEWQYQTRESWAVKRRVIGKAEHLAGGPNPRFIVTNLAADTHPAQPLYEDTYCARGGAGENQIRAQQLELFADRTSSYSFHANQLRLHFSAFAYVFMLAIRHLGLHGTALAKANCQTLRLKLFKVGAQLIISVRRFYIACATATPHEALFRLVLTRLAASG